MSKNKVYGDNMSKEEVWIKPWGDLVLVEWNACRCHPNDVSMTWGKKFNESGWYGKQNKSSWTKGLKKKGWERLSVEKK